MKFALIGDIALNGLFVNDSINNNKRLNEISKILNNVDFAIANLETPIYISDNHPPNKILIHTSKEVLNYAVDTLNIKILSLGNNHILDCGNSGLIETEELLKSKSIYCSGASTNHEGAKPKIVEINGLKIGFISYVQKNLYPKNFDTNSAFINFYDEGKIIEDIHLLRKDVDFIILSIHWGRDYSNYFEPWQQKAAYKFVEEGVDIILGHHPHTVQSYEIYKGKLIFYSLGGICFGDFYQDGILRALRRKTKRGLVAIINEKFEIIDLLETKEKKGNFITIKPRTIKNKIKRLFVINVLKNRFKAFGYLLRFKESFLDRIYEFFFGYYRKPLKQLLNYNNYRKIKYMFRDYKK